MSDTDQEMRDGYARVLDEMARFVAAQRNAIPKRRSRDFRVVRLDGTAVVFSRDYADRVRDLLDRDFGVVTMCAEAVRNGWQAPDKEAGSNG